MTLPDAQRSRGACHPSQLDEDGQQPGLSRTLPAASSRRLQQTRSTEAEVGVARGRGWGWWAGSGATCQSTSLDSQGRSQDTRVSSTSSAHPQCRTRPATVTPWSLLLESPTPFPPRSHVQAQSGSLPAPSDAECASLSLFC